MTLVKKLKKYIKKQLKQYRILYQKKFMAFSLGEFISALKALGLEAGDNFLYIVHMISLLVSEVSQQILLRDCKRLSGQKVWF